MGTKTTKTTTKNGKKHKTTVQHCTTKLVSRHGQVHDQQQHQRRRTGGGVTYATGLAIPTGTGRWQLI